MKSLMKHLTIILIGSLSLSAQAADFPQVLIGKYAASWTSCDKAGQSGTWDGIIISKASAIKKTEKCTATDVKQMANGFSISQACIEDEEDYKRTTEFSLIGSQLTTTTAGLATTFSKCQ